MGGIHHKRDSHRSVCDVHDCCSAYATPAMKDLNTRVMACWTDVKIYYTRTVNDDVYLAT